MNDVRERALRSKRSELSRIATSRKRKLRELYAVTVATDPGDLPDLRDANAPATTIAEARFLEVSDLLQDRPFDESNLPARRQLRSGASKQAQASRKTSPDGRPSEGSRKAAKAQRDASKTRKSRATTPRGNIGTVATSATMEHRAEPLLSTTTVPSMPGLPMQRSTSKGSQTDLPADASMALEQIVEETFENAKEHQSPPLGPVVPDRALQTEGRMKRASENLPAGGMDPRKALPISAEDAANLLEPLVPGLGSHDMPHKAVTAHLPPKEIQERRLKERVEVQEHRDENAGRLSINPPRDSVRHADVLSSPSSTIDAHSATTPAMHEASADTSPENESRYDADVLDQKEDDDCLPVGSKGTPDVASERDHHNKILKAQIEISTAEIPKKGAVEQLQEAEAHAASSLSDVHVHASDARVPPGRSSQEEKVTQLTLEASEVAKSIVEDVNEVTRASSSHDGVAFTPQVPNVEPEESTKQPEIPDSEADEEATPVADAMDVGVATVKDSFESSAPLGSTSRISPVVPHLAETISNAAMDASKPSTTPAPTSPRRASPISAPPVERMTTRISSGAMRHKSVAEMIEESSGSEPVRNSHSHSRSNTPQSPSARLRLAEKAREKERTKLSMVVFPGPPPKPVVQASNSAALSPPAASDYYYEPLFIGRAYAKKGTSLENLVATAHKTITTDNSNFVLQESQTEKVLDRILALQRANMWSLRQLKRSPEPIRPTSHWDLLLQEAKWMRTDFREEGKWKRAAARNLAFACAEWVECGAEDRKLLQVKASPPKPVELETETANEIEMGDVSSQAGTHPTPDLIASGEFDSPMEELDEEPRLDLTETVSPTAIFGLQNDEIVCGLRRSPTTEKLLNELPMYGAPLRVPANMPTPQVDPDRFWRRAALPVTKYVEGRMELKPQPALRKKSRYEHDLEDEDEDQVVFGQPQTERTIFPPESTDVALFHPDHKHIRDRIHSSHQFKPPTEFPMPLQSFFECRTPSQWTYDEDNDLKSHVREYSYNWSLISSLLAPPSLFVTGAERRTPWECFERWIQLEGLPADMQKTHYFRAYTSRMDAANRNILAQNNALSQQANANGPMQQATPRRRPTTSVRVERRRNARHLTLVNAMQKLAKKRETNAQKQAQAANMAAMRKANEAPPPNRNLLATTPQDFSRLKHDREEAFKERMQALHARNEAIRRGANNPQQQQQARNLANPQQPGLPGGGPPRPANSSLPVNAAPTPNGQNLPMPGQNRPPRPVPPQIPTGQPVPNNNLRGPQMGMNGVPAAQMLGQMPLANPSVDHGLVSRAHQISQQQQAILRQQQGQLAGQSPQMHNSPPRMNGMPQPGFPMQNNMMPPFNPNANGVSTPPANPHMPSPVQGHAGSPRIGQNPLQHPTVQVMEQQIKQMHPNATPEQVMRMIQERLSKTVAPSSQYQQQQQRQGLAQSAMNAAAGAGGHAMPGMNGMSASQGTPQHYAQMLRQQQENQQKAAQAQQQAASLVASGPGPGPGPAPENRTPGGGSSGGGGNSAQGHAHRASSSSVQSGK